MTELLPSFTLLERLPRVFVRIPHFRMAARTGVTLRRVAPAGSAGFARRHVPTTGSRVPEKGLEEGAPPDVL